MASRVSLDSVTKWGILCLGGETNKTGLQIVRYFQEPFLFFFGCAAWYTGFSLAAASELLSSRGVIASLGSGLSRCRAWTLRLLAFSSCSAWAQQFQVPDSRAQAQWLRCTDSVAPWHVGSSQMRDQTHVSCTSRWTLPLSLQGSPRSPFFEPNSCVSSLEKY